MRSPEMLVCANIEVTLNNKVSVPEIAIVMPFISAFPFLLPSSFSPSGGSETNYI
jgi:hypothetical protein